MATPKLIISESRPLRTIAVVAILLLLTIIGQWYYHQIRNQTLYGEVGELEQALEQLSGQHNQLLLQLNDVAKHKVSLEQNLSEQQQTNTIQQATEQQLQQQLTELQAQVMDLKKELMFYQNITQGNSTSELQVREVFITETELPDVYRYRIVITQGKKVSKPLTGNIKLVLNTADSEKGSDIAEHKLNLRHIQVIEGSVNIAEKVTPKAINISISQGKKTRVNKTVDWQISPS